MADILSGICKEMAFAPVCKAYGYRIARAV